MTTTALLPLPVDEWDEILDFVVEDMNGSPFNVHKLMAYNPALLAAWWNFRNYSVKGGSLGSRCGELVILRVGVQLSAWYEWGSHVDRSLRCGLTLEEINRVLEKSVARNWDPREAALLLAVDELVEHHELSQSTQVELSRYFSVAQVLDIIAIHGMYVILGCMIRSFGLEMDPAITERIRPHTSETGFLASARRFHQDKD